MFLGKLNMHEFAYGGDSTVSHFGPVRNPWNVEYITADRRGSAAAVAARLCAAALGTDTAGSIRMPAALCGVVGLKGTHRLASIRGIIPLSESHDHVGPICRSVDPLDPMSIASAPANYADAIGRPVSSLRIGVPRAPFFADLDREIGTAVETALEVIRTPTRSVVDVTVPAVDTLGMPSAEIYAYHAKYVTDQERRKLYQPQTRRLILDGAAISLPTYIEGYRRMLVARNTIGAVFANVDLLVTPTTRVMPGPISNPPTGRIRNTVPFNALGIPSISVPCGFSRGGFPIGLQVSGPRLREAQVLALAHAYEQTTEWHRRQPAMP